MTLDQREQAIRRIRSKRELRVHAVIYVAVNALLVGIWALTSGGYFWPAWPILGWGIGLVAHALTTYLGTSEISEAQIERELRS